MGRLIDELLITWDALSGNQMEQEGWRGIPVSMIGNCTLLGARHFPGNREALLACFPSIRLSAAEHLPDGRGFEVIRADPYGDGKTWIALSRRESGSPELFAEMVADVAGVMDITASAGEERTLQAMLRRVRMWQQFMSKGARPLGREAELGLAGELAFLGILLDAGLPADEMLMAWVGPEDAPQDFVLGTGAIEVKATLSADGMQVRIGNLEQLDDSRLSPLFLALIRFAGDDRGLTLPGLVTDIMTRLQGDQHVITLFRERILAAGYHDYHASQYTRRFFREEDHIYGVATGFPRLITGQVEGIMKATYEIDLGCASALTTDLNTALNQLGVQQNDT